jgi:hypothetical protein
MATLIISRYAAVENNMGSGPCGSQSLTTSGTSAQSSGNTNGAAAVMLYSTAAHWFVTAADPTATATNGAYLPASTPIWVKVGMGEKIAAITVA